MREEQFHNKIIWFSFLFSILVIWIHSYNSELYLGLTSHEAVIWSLEHLFGELVGQIAVPGFFMISSYLFYRNFTWRKLKIKWLSRIHSILIPYIIWNALYYLGYVIASRLPFFSEVVGKGVIPLNLPTALEAVASYSYNYVFWYLYQLILLIILTPVIYYLIKNTYIAVIWLLLLLASIYFEISLPQLNTDALFYYSAAAFGALHLGKEVEHAWNARRCAVGFFLLAGSILVVIFTRGRISRGPLILSIVLTRFFIPLSLWLLISEKALPEPLKCMKHNFFLYAVHFAIVRFINKAGALFYAGIPYLPFIIYLLMPLAVIIISYYLGEALRRFTPCIWVLLNGGR